MLYGCPFLTNDFLINRETDALLKDITSLAKFQQTLQELTEAQPTEKGNPIFHRGDLVLVKSPPSSAIGKDLTL